MNDCENFWRVCLQNPDDALPRRVFADWLSENVDETAARDMRSLGGSILVRSESSMTPQRNLMSGVQSREEISDRVWDAVETSVHDLLAKSVGELIHTEEVGIAIAETNAHGFQIYEHNTELLQAEEEECTAQVLFWAIGNQNEDTPYSGHTIQGSALATIRPGTNEGLPFDVVYSEVDAHVEDEDFEGEMEDF